MTPDPSPSSRILRLRFIVAAIIVALGFAACSQGDDEAGSEDEPTIDNPADEFDFGPAPEGDEGAGQGGGGQAAPGPGAPPIHPALTELGGQLAIVDGGDVTVVNPDGTGGAIIDGQSIREAVASQPVWSIDGARLAWATTDPQGVTVSVLGGETADEIVRSEGDGTPVFYLQWSSSGTELVYLRNSSSGGVEAGVAVVGEQIEPLASGQPFYVSWSPDGDALLAHVGGSFAGSAGEVVLLEGDLGDDDQVLRPTISFTAPAWLDDTTIVGAADGGLVSVDLATGASELLVESPGPVQFVVSPDGGAIAYRAPRPGEDEPDPPLLVLDLATGDTSLVLERGALAWEWSPGGDRLAVLGPDSASGFEQIGLGQDGFDRARLDQAGLDEVEAAPVQSNTDPFRWYFWQDGGIFGATPPHTPTPLEAGAYLPFFEQYAQSHHRWSGDGAGFAFAGSVDGALGIWVQLAEDTSTASLVARGAHVTWSPLTGAVGGGRSIQ